LVEQRPEEPCVPSSSLGGATKKKVQELSWTFFFFLANSVILVYIFICYKYCMFTRKNPESYSNIFTAIRDPKIADIESPFGPAIIYGDDPNDTQDFMLEVARTVSLDGSPKISSLASRGFHAVVNSMAKIVSARG
jgi:hypothetical protein